VIQRSDQPIGYEISTSAGEDGTIEAAYIRFSHGPVAETREINGDVLLADFDKEGNLVGVEILAPVKISVLTELVQPPKRAPFERFIREAAPQKLVKA
jgi:uncharacterized protein YuzE